MTSIVNSGNLNPPGYVLPLNEQESVELSTHPEEIAVQMPSQETMDTIGSVLHRTSMLFKGQKDQIKNILVKSGPCLDYKERSTDGYVKQFEKDVERSTEGIIIDPKNNTDTEYDPIKGQGPKRVEQMAEQIRHSLITEKDQRWELPMQSLITQTILNAIGMTLKGSLSVQLVMEDHCKWTANGEDYVLTAEFSNGEPPIELHLIRDKDNNIIAIKVQLDADIDIVQKRTKSDKDFFCEVTQVIVPTAISAHIEFIVTLDNDGAPTLKEESVFMEATVNAEFPDSEGIDPPSHDIRKIDLEAWSQVLDQALTSPRQFLTQLGEREYDIFLLDQTQIDSQEDWLPEDLKVLEGMRFKKASLDQVKQITLKFLESASIDEEVTPEDFKHHVQNLSDKLAELEYADLSRWQAFLRTAFKVMAIAGACLLISLVLTIPLGLWIFDKIRTAHYLTDADKEVVKAMVEQRKSVEDLEGALATFPVEWGTVAFCKSVDSIIRKGSTPIELILPEGDYLLPYGSEGVTSHFAMGEKQSVEISKGGIHDTKRCPALAVHIEKGADLKYSYPKENEIRELCSAFIEKFGESGLCVANNLFVLLQQNLLGESFIHLEKLGLFAPKKERYFDVHVAEDAVTVQIYLLNEEQFPQGSEIDGRSFVEKLEMVIPIAAMKQQLMIANDIEELTEDTIPVHLQGVTYRSEIISPVYSNTQAAKEQFHELLPKE